MKKLFGTDGIRGRAGEPPLDEPTVRLIGHALAEHLAVQLGRPAKLVTGRDTRESGSWIETAFHSGALAAGAACESAEIITTPGIAFLTGKFGFDAGVVISASHNPYHDNGIKIFMPSGRKSDEATEVTIETAIAKGTTVPAGDASVSPARVSEFHYAYVGHLRNTVEDLSLTGLHIVVDCANGAACQLGPELFRQLGAKVTAIHNQPDGRNINADCGSLHLEHLQARVAGERADLGIAFDGDADRSLFVDENGNVVDGDATLWILAQYLKGQGGLKNSSVVATVMSNIGLELALKSKAIELDRVDVGDKYVLEELLSSGSELGGEQSGHIILPEISLVGDGIMTSLLLLRALTKNRQRLSEAVAGFVQYPQILVNVKVAEKRPFNEVPEIAAAAEDLSQKLNGSGRLLLRYSGTENLARVMIEGSDQVQIERQAKGLAAVIAGALG